MTNDLDQIRRLNDRLRQTGHGGRVMLTTGIHAQGPEFVAAVLAAVAAFAAFSPANDPHGEHDCALLTVMDQEVLWKVDYYDVTLSAGSPDPADPAVTERVLTIMLAGEY